MWHYLCFQKYPQKEWKKKLGPVLTLDLDQFLTLETPNLGPVFNSTAYIYIAREREYEKEEFKKLGWNKGRHSKINKNALFRGKTGFLRQKTKNTKTKIKQKQNKTNPQKKNKKEKLETTQKQKGAFSYQSNFSVS